MNRRILILTRGLVVLILVTVLTMVFPRTALACSGNSCYGQDPYSQGCTSSAYTIKSYTGTGSSGSVTGTLWYSSACVANWAVATSNSGNRYIRAEVTMYQWQYSSTYGASIYSNMVDGNSFHCAGGFMDTVNRTYYNTFSGNNAYLAAGCG
jgi:Protein of unknown function (DUF2690)